MSESAETYDPRYLVGVLLFNDGDFFEAHEVWEDLWAEAAGDERRFYQGLIQAAVGLCHFGNGNLRGARKLYTTSREYMRNLPDSFRGLNLHQFWHEMETCFAPVLNDASQAAPIALDESTTPHLNLDPPPVEWPDPHTFMSCDDE
jgi:hypothetical protein